MSRAAPAILVSTLLGCTYSPVPLETGDAAGDQVGTGGDVGSGDDVACEVVGDPCGGAGYECGTVVVMDSCNQVTELLCGVCASPDTCGGGGVSSQCGRLPWYPLGNSEFGPHSTRIIWGSASGGGISNSKMRTDFPRVRVDSSDRPVVSWDDAAKLKVARWNGGTWTGFGGSLGAGVVEFGVESDLALESDGDPVVVWRAEDMVDANQIFLNRWAGSAWEDVYGSGMGRGLSDSTADSRDPALALDGYDAPVVAWHEPAFGPTRNIYVKQVSGGAWGGLHGSASAMGVSGTAELSYSPAVAVDSADRIVLAWVEDIGGPTTVFLRRSGTSGWDELAGSATGNGVTDGLHFVNSPAVAIGGDVPTVVWANQGTPDWIGLKQYNGTIWVELAGSAAEPGVALGRMPALAVDDAGHPAVASVDNGTDQLEVHRWSGSQWSALGGPGGLDPLSMASPLHPSIALDGGGDPVVVWASNPDGAVPQIYAAHWDGAGWVEYSASMARPGGISNDSGYSWNPAVSMSAALHPVVAWQSSDGVTDKIFLRKWRGDAWVELSGSATGGGVTPNTNDNVRPNVALDDTGRAVVAWQGNGMGNADIYVRRYAGSVWEDFAGSSSGGGISVNDSQSESPSLALDNLGRPFVAWTDEDPVGGVPQIYLRAWDGSVWQELAGSGSGGGLSDTITISSGARVVLDADNKPVVAWREDVAARTQIYVARWTGSAWVGYDGSNTGNGATDSTYNSRAPALTLDGNGQPVIAWRAITSDNQILVSRFDGNAWQAPTVVYTNMDPGALVPNPLAPELVTDSTGAPIVVWRAETGASTNIFARRWNAGDTQWEEIAGSASTGGISNSGANSFEPAVTIFSDRLCVAWAEAGKPSVEILMRCTDL